jgi:hypothetical protein
MIDIRKETLLPLAQAARHPRLPRRRRGKRPHAATLYRYAKSGYKGIVLETMRFAGTLCTSEEALQRFCERLSDADVPRTHHLPAPAASEDAGQKLSELGI